MSSGVKGDRKSRRGCASNSNNFKNKQFTRTSYKKDALKIQILNLKLAYDCGFKYEDVQNRLSGSKVMVEKVIFLKAGETFSVYLANYCS